MTRRRQHTGKRVDKAKTLAAHAGSRLHERYGLAHRDAEAIAQLIRDGKSTPVEKQSNARSVHDVVYDGVTIRVVYDRERKCLITALPKEAIGS